MMINKDINNFDYQTIVVRKEKADEVLANYKSFGWQILEEKQHDVYDNLLNVVLVRDHFIKNKDELQYLQVNMEINVNKRGKAEKHKHSKSFILGMNLGLFAMIFLTNMFLSIFMLTGAIRLALAIGFGVLSLVLIVLDAVFVPMLIKKENMKYEKNMLIFNQSIKESCEKAKALTGVKDE